MNRIAWKASLLAAFGLAIFFGARSLRLSPNGGREWVFDEPAYTPEATSEDFRQETLSVADAVLRAFPNRTASLAVSARVEYSLGHSAKAKELWQQAAQLDADFANAYFALGKIAKDEANYDKAVELLGQAMRLAPLDPHTPPLLAQALMESRRFEEAIDVLRRYMSNQKATPKAVLNLARSYVETGQDEKARITFEAMVENYRDEPSALSAASYSLFQLYTRLGKPEKADENHLAFLKHKPKDAEIIADSQKYQDIDWLRNLLVKTLWESGQAYHEYGNMEKTEESWQRAAYLDPEHTECRTELLELYEQIDRDHDHDALVIASQLSTIEPMNPDHWRNVGLLKGRLGQLEDAREALKRAMRLDPGNPSYREILEMLN